MDIRKKIIRELERKGKVKTSDIVRATGFSRAYINRFFQKLQEEGRVVLIGKANRAYYVFATEGAISLSKNELRDISLNLKNQNLHEDQVLAEIKKKTGIFVALKRNAADILDYAFSEMLNNAIEHSQSEAIKVTMKRYENNVTFSVVDEGIGIFNNIIKKNNLRDVMDAIQGLLKGKQTTAPDLHSGEGIFFTSKVCDLLIIRGSNKKLIFDNLLEDIFIKDIKPINGTKVNFSIATASKKNLSGIFKQYTDSSYEFNRTVVTVRLFKIGSQYISRSQARRIVSGLDKFRAIILDFKGIETIGQGFADEIFRVWQSNHPEIKIDVSNANDNVQFMIKRAKSVIL